jgi:dolichyl-phosphate beta-glucosyltransferase
MVIESPPPHLSLVVPVYNAESRVPDALEEIRRFLCAQSYSSELILVDDHSTDGTRDLLTAFAARNAGVTLLRNETNCGKGHSVRRGMLAARGERRVFTDADLAYPADEIAGIVGALDDGADVAVACRVLPESRYLMSPSFFSYLYTRHAMSRLFNALVRHTLAREMLDTQAGLKGFTARAAELIFPRLTIPGFAFDVEALVIARRQRLTIRQLPVFFRYLDEPSTVRFASDAAMMAGDLVRIWQNRVRGRYD